MDEGNPKTWRVKLTPHRSLTHQGFVILMGAIALINFAMGFFFYLLGAWPVVGFLGLDVVLVWWAFRANFASARRIETIEVTAHELILERFADGRERHEKRFVRRWVRVELEEDRERELIGGLYLLSHGTRTEIGDFLAPGERQELAGVLKAALASPHI